MNKTPTFLIMTAHASRHHFFANHLIATLPVVGVISETKRPVPGGQTEEDDAMIKAHLAERDQVEQGFFGTQTDFHLPSDQILRVPYGDSNSGHTADWMANKKPDYIILFGTAIIQDHILAPFSGRVINMHLGLSPYYRGSGTNFWPLVNGEPECVGVTIHLATLKVDAGAILGQVRPQMFATDRAHEIGNRAIQAGAELMVKVCQEYPLGQVPPQPQNLQTGKVYKQKDFNAEAVRMMWKNFENGMIPEYLKHQTERDARYPLVTL